MALGVVGRLVEDGSGRPLRGLNVRVEVLEADDSPVQVGFDTTTEDGSFSVGGGSSEASATGTFRLRFEVLDGTLELIYRMEQDVVLESPDELVNVTIAAPFAVEPTQVNAPSAQIEEGVAGLRVVPEQVSMPLGGRVVLIAAARDEDGVPVAGVSFEWRARKADGEEVPVSSGGEFVGRMPGVYEVVARGGGQEGAATVTVLDYDPTPASAASIASALALEDGGEGPRWNDDNAASAFAPTNSVGRPAATLFDAMLDRPWLGVRHDEFREVVTSGSANYTFSAPILRLDGRGMSLRLDLTYNSRLWNRSEDVVEFDVDQGWPAPGWSLGFGRIVRLGRQGSMVVDADGTRHPYEVLRLEGDENRRLEFAGRTTDGSFIDYEHVDDSSGGFQWAQARYPDGTTVEYTARGHDYRFPLTGALHPGWGVLFPTRITDANGNMIMITYRGNIGPEIDTIVDTLGRTVSFHYDAENQLTAITAPGLDGARRTLVRLNLVRMRLEPAFAGLRVVRRDLRAPLVMRAIYYPGTTTGYWFGDPWTYSMYGMATRVTRHRGMGFDNSPLTQAGAITPGTLTHERSYNYPLVADPALGDVPTYTSMTEIWEGMDTPPAVTRFAAQLEGDPRRIEVTYPNGTRTVTFAYNRHHQPGQFDDGLPYQQEVYDGDRLAQVTTTIWQQGDYWAPRVWRVETTRDGSLMTATEYDYGPYNQVTEVREFDFGGTAVLRRTRTEYEPTAGYLRRHIFSLPSVVEVFQGYESQPTTRTEYVYDSQPLRDTPGAIGHAQTHNPYAPRNWVPPYDELDCDPDPTPGTPPCRTIHHDGYWQTDYDAWTRFRGNPTEIRRYADPVLRRDPVIERRSYDITGNLVLAEAGPYERSVFEYSLATQYAYPVRHVLGPAQPASAQMATSVTRDFGTGLVRSTTDANGRTTQVSHEPDSLRPRRVVWPAGATTTFDYDDHQPAVTETTRVIDGTMADQRTTTRNGLGLVQQEATLIDIEEVGDLTLNIQDINERRYDPLGRLWKQSRPHRTGQTPYFTEVFRDALGRVIRTRSADGSETHAYYGERARPDDAPAVGAGGYTTRLVDAWGRERWTLHNALGQLQIVVEPDPTGDGSVLTPGTAASYYVYNALDQMVMLTQRPPAPQNRWFRYDGLGRLTHQTLTERTPTLNDTGQYRAPGSGARWSDVFAYADGTRLGWRMDARGVRTVFDYGDDPLGRLQRIIYERTSVGNPANPDPDNPPAPASAVRLEYASSGDLTRLARVTTDSTVEEYSYDDGQLTSKVLVLPDEQRLAFAIDYSYDSLDRLRSITYPAQYGMDGAPRKHLEFDYHLASRARRLTVDGLDQASDIAYGPCGRTAEVTVGAGSTKPVTEVYDCNPANGLLSGQRVLRDSETLLNLSYDYERPGRSGVTRELVRTIDNLDPRRTRSYDYDPLGRLRQASSGTPDSPLWMQRYTYDRYGNRTDVVASSASRGDAVPQDGVSGLTFSRPAPQGLSRTDNRVSSPGFTYDEAGNLTRSQRPDGRWQRYQHDAAGRLVSVTDDAGTPLETYTYGAGMRRIGTRDDQAGTQACHIWHGDNVVAEYDYDEQPRWTRALVYLGRRLLCTYTTADETGRRPGTVEQLRYHHPDRLGTRLITTPESDEAIELTTLPYGTLVTPDLSPTGTPTFTSYDRSRATGLDYAINRYYDPQLGRFLQPDLLGAAAITPGDPASNNHYIYGRCDPVNTLDPSGLACTKEWYEWSYSYYDSATETVEIHVIGSWNTSCVGDPDEFTREDLRRERRERERIDPPVDLPADVAEAGLSFAAYLRLLAAIARIAATAFDPTPATPPDPSQLPRPTAPRSYEFDIQRGAEEAARRRGGGGRSGGGTGTTLIISFHPGMYRGLHPLLDRLMRPSDPNVLY